MFKTYIKASLRHLWKNKGLSFINIFGLAAGIAFSLLIFLYVTDERSYDKFNKDPDRIYRVVKDFGNDDGTLLPDATTPPAVAPALQKELPEVETSTRLFPSWGREYLIKAGDKKLLEQGVYRVDSSFFNVFTFPFIKGTAASAFSNINSVVITESAARKYFGNTDVLGKTMTIDDLGDMAVTGVIKDVPSNAHFHFDFLVSVRTFPRNNMDGNWNWYNFYTYIKVKPNTNIAALNIKIQNIYKKNDTDPKNVFYTQQLTSIHLNSHLKWELEPNSDELYVNIFALIAMFILLIAAINYVNLTTANASVRAKEIGVRKVAGAHRSSLIRQFLIESIIVCVIAAVVALTIAELLLPLAKELTQKELTVTGNLTVLGYLFGAAVLLGCIAGFFPALYLSSFKPILVLKGFKLKEKETLSLRKVLVVVQFTISSVLIIGAIIISQQMHFIHSSKLGLNKEQVLIIKNGFPPAKRNAFINEAAQIPGVKLASSADGVVGGLNWTNGMSLKGSKNSQLINFLSVGYNFTDVMGMEMKEGRGFSSKFEGDTMSNGIPNGPLDQNIGSIILNETAVKDLGIPSPATGSQILWSTDADTMYYLTVVGVVKDFHFTTLRNQIKPFAFITNPRRQWYLTLRLNPDNTSNTLAQLENIWKRFDEERPFTYSFLDQTYSKLYSSESRFQQLFIILVVLGIIIACLGLLGLTTFAAQKRVKEIGIRKVLGASVLNVVSLLTKDFLKLVLISLLLAVPLGWWAMSRWLHDFAYRINVEWWVFILAAVIAIVIALITISTHAFRAAIANPVKSLRTE